MYVSLSMAESTLAALTQTCHDKRGRNARQFEVECAVELAMAHIRRMQADLPQGHAAFEQQWHMAASAIQLADKAFKLPRSRYGRSLKHMRLHFDLLKGLVERVKMRSRRAAWGAGGRVGYGRPLMESLSVDLAARFGRGLSPDNLENVRRFFLAYPWAAISETVSRKSDRRSSPQPTVAGRHRNRPTGQRLLDLLLAADEA